MLAPAAPGCCSCEASDPQDLPDGPEMMSVWISDVVATEVMSVQISDVVAMVEDTAGLGGAAPPAAGRVWRAPPPPEPPPVPSPSRPPPPPPLEADPAVETAAAFAGHGWSPPAQDGGAGHARFSDAGPVRCTSTSGCHDLPHTVGRRLSIASSCPEYGAMLSEEMAYLNPPQRLRHLAGRLQPQQQQQQQQRTSWRPSWRMRNISLESNVLELVTFKGSEDLLRASSLGKVMRDRARVFATSEGSAETYAMSRVVPHIDAFISHNWSVPRYKKFFSLAVHFNLGPAVLVAAATLVLLCLLTAYGFLPTIQGHTGGTSRGFLCKVLATPVFFLVLCFYRDLGWRCGCDGPMVFVDKTCINQADKDIQRQGIEKLAAFLCNSNSMVIIYSDVYLRRLWTVYEVAAFMALKGTQKMEVIPTSMPLVLIFSLMVVYFATNAAFLLEVATGVTYALDVSVLLLSYTLMLAIRHWARQRSEIQSAVAKFNVSQCTCANDPEDRRIVYSNIASLMKAIGLVGSQDTEHRALAAFNKLVRETLPTAIRASVGPLGLRYRHFCVIAGSGCIPYCLDDAAGAYGRDGGRVLEDVFLDLVWWGMMTLAIAPLLAAACASLAGRCLALRGWHEKLYCAALQVSGCAVGFAVGLLTSNLGHLDRAGLPPPATTMGRAILCVIDVALIVGAIAVFAGHRIREACFGIDDYEVIKGAIAKMAMTPTVTLSGSTTVSASMRPDALAASHEVHRQSIIFSNAGSSEHVASVVSSAVSSLQEDELQADPTSGGETPRPVTSEWL